MPSCRSTSNQNTRVFAPHVILQQDTTRLAITIKSGEGYTLQTGLTAGDVIRYDPIDQSYKKSQADTEVHAEVLGVIESGSAAAAQYTVVVSGSITYPAAKLTAIPSGGDGGKDILFLDENVAGGLTGTINLDEGVKIVKPVIQVAPHGNYNGVVVNYIGYKTGNTPSGSNPVPFTSSIIFGKEGLENDVWLPLSQNLTLNVNDYPQVYSTYGTSYGIWSELLTISTGTVVSGLVGQQAYQLTSGGGKYNTGTVTAVDTGNATITIQKNATSDSMDTSKAIYVGGTAFTASVTDVVTFTVPKVENIQGTQGGEALVPYLKTYDTSSVTIPQELTINQLTVDSNLAVGAVTDVEAKLAELENKINLLNSRVSAF